MKRQVKFQILIIIILTIILGTMCYYYFTSDNKEYFDYSEEENAQVQVQKNNSSEVNSKTSSNNNEKTVSTTAEVVTGLTEKKELHATYYLEDSYIEENKEFSAGDNLIKYTNGEYLTAPYDCVVTKISIPEVSSKCTNEHYIQIESTKNLALQIKVSESTINKLSIGDEAEIEITALSKTITGNITKISNTAQNGKFTVTVEFKNDGEIKLGMTAKVVI
ncbi:MAG: HlyD family efflux transporter periplasmic adaptor subunit [Clostridia bacterium]|nr:HlyD family efflux transporter periplasmic adaptor subunit [Clostridia bacterium]